MSKRVLKIVGWVAALLLVLGVGAAVGGGIVYAMRPDSDSISFTFRPNGAKLFESEPGVVIAAVVPDGPAAEADVVRGNILLQVDGESVDDVIELMRVLAEHQAGDKVDLTVLHGDDERTLTATLGNRDDVAYLGLVPCASIPGSVGRKMTIHAEGSGAMILDVSPDSPADRAGLQEGDVIVAVDGQELAGENNLADVIAAYEPGDTVTLQVEQPGKEPRDVTVELGEHPDKEGVAYLSVQYRPARPIRLLQGERIPFVWPHDGSLPHGEFHGQGTLVRHVDEDSPAEAAGLRQGDLITAVDGDPVEGPRDLSDAIAEHAPGDEVALTVSSRGEDQGEREVEVTLAEHPEEEGKAYLGVQVGGFIRIHRSKDGKEHELEHDLFQEAPFDGIPFELHDKERHFEFRFPPGHFDGGGAGCCGNSI
ncbi:MAG: PDZ domain-containing protein [Anaerolineae bacterium]